MAKTKALISFAVTAKLICVFVFAYADCWFSHEAAQIIMILIRIRSTLVTRMRSISPRKPAVGIIKWLRPTGLMACFEAERCA